MEKIINWNACTGKLIDGIGEFDVIECVACGFKHIVPVPTVEQLETVYRHDYYTKEKPLYMERYNEDVEWWNLVYAMRYNVFERHLSPNKRRILDVGSGPGLFLLHGKERGWQPYGVEPSIQAATYSKDLGLDVMHDFLTSETAAKLGTFDVIHLSLVLEHIPDPISFLRLIHSMLNPGGIICVVTPNDYNPFQLALRNTCNYPAWWVAPPHHINYFNFRSLELLLKRSGFSIVQRETTFPIDMFLLMGDRYVGDDAVGRVCHGKRKHFELNLHNAGQEDVLKKLYRSLSRIGIGREVVLFGKVAQ